MFGVNLKYGGGPPNVRKLLERASGQIAISEGMNAELALFGEQSRAVLMRLEAITADARVLEEQLVSSLRLIANLKPSHHWSADDISS